MRRLIRWIRPDITGDVHHATALLARAALVRLERGHSHDAVRAWVDNPRRRNRYGSLATLAVYELLRAPYAYRPVRVVGCADPEHVGIADLCCGDCNPDGSFRARFTVADLDAMADAGEISTRLLAAVALVACAALAVWTVVATGPAADGRGILAVAIAAALLLTLSVRDRRGSVR